MSKKRRTTEALVAELREFHHNEAAERLAWLQVENDQLKERVMSAYDNHELIETQPNGCRINLTPTCGKHLTRLLSPCENQSMRQKRTGATAPVSEKIPHLTITIGLPGSGKSTWAEQTRQAQPDRVRIVNRDDIRASLCTRYEDNDEPIVERIRDYQIDQLLIAGYHVISSDTNLSPRVRRRLTQIAKTRKATTSEQSFIDVPLDVCLTRNTARWIAGDRKVPNSAIEGMHNQFINQGASASTTV